MNNNNGKRNGNGNGGGKQKKKNGGSRVTNTVRQNNVSLPMQIVSNNQRALNNSFTRLSGSDFIGAITVKPQTMLDLGASQRVLSVVPITPSGFVGTRLTALSNLWERYRFISCKIRYVPAIPTTLGCQLCFYIDTDPNDDPSGIADGNALIRQAIAQTGAQQWNFATPKIIPLALRKDDQLYYTGNDKTNQRFNRQGTGYMIQITGPVAFDGSPITTELQAGSLFIDWDVMFQTAQINPESLNLLPGLLNGSFSTTSTALTAGVYGTSDGLGVTYINAIVGLQPPPTTTVESVDYTIQPTTFDTQIAMAVTCVGTGFTNQKITNLRPDLITITETPGFNFMTATSGSLVFTFRLLGIKSEYNNTVRLFNISRARTGTTTGGFALTSIP